MKFKTLHAIVLLVVLSIGQLAAGTLQGKVTDADNGDALIGANVTIEGTTMGAATDMNGEYTVENVPAGTYTVIISYVGYTEAVLSVTVGSGATTLNAQLTASGIGLNAVTISASRRPEKALEAPASVTVMEAREFTENSGLSSVDALRNTTGVDVAQTGIDRQEIVLRGFNNAFNGATYILTDYRQAAAPALGVNVHSIMPNMAIDIDKVEVVRGPGSALYGAGVDAGVIHYISKDPFTYPGTAVSLGMGERSAYMYSVRHVGKLTDNLAYKVTGQYGEADDWEYDPKDRLDAAQLATFTRPPQRDYQKRNVNGMLQYRMSDDVTITANGGYSDLTGTVLTGIGTVQGDQFALMYGQLRLQAGRLFAQAYLNKNDANNSFVYGTGDKVVDKGQQLNVQAQYDFEMAEGKQQFIVGADMDQTKPETEGTIYGRNDEDDTINEMGGYLQSLTRLTPKLDLTAAVRGDYDNIIEEVSVSPRVGLVFKPGTSHAFRATYNRAFALPGTNSMFLDIVAGQAGPITVRGRGSKDGYTWQRNAAYGAVAGTDLVARSLNPAALGAATPVGMDLGTTYASVHAGIAAVPADQLAAQLSAATGLPINAATATALVGLLSPASINVNGFSRGQMAIPSLSGGLPSPVSNLADVEPLQHTISQTFEVGYKGLIGDKVLFAVDGYYSIKENFVGPLIMETPLVFVPTLSSDLTGAIASGISGNEAVAQQFAGLGLTPQQVAAIVTGFAAGSLPGASTPIAIVVPAENDLGVGQVPELMLTYRNFGKIKFWGIDASMNYFLDQNTSVFGNVSYVSDDFFDNEELDEANSSLALALNAPTLKIKGGLSINVPRGASANASIRYVKGFPVLSGPYVGGLPAPYGNGLNGVEDYVIYDLNLGYDLSRWYNGLRIDLIGQNIFDNRHREFIGAPKIGRLGMARLTLNM